MQLHGIHHITAITADARRNLSFYAELLGLRFVKKTVNFDDPTAYHLYYGDERGTPGSILTFFEYPGAPLGRAGDGMIHRLVWRVAGEPALDFWNERLARAGVRVERSQAALRFSDPEGLGLELSATGDDEPALSAASAGVPPAVALRGFDGVRAYGTDPQASERALGEVLGFERSGAALDGGVWGEALWRVGAGGRSSGYVYDPAPSARGVQGAGTVHHIAWAVPDADQPAWRERIVSGGLYATPVIDRTYFRSVYFREPSGVLFEIATLGPGFAIDEPQARLGEALRLPPRYEHLRPRLERLLTPLVSPREREREAA
ncbi:MAG TPA: VOC family protein [Thermoleophilia bacterium]|nr:VOC family protein [Thermoleophilia bacterium]